MVPLPPETERSLRQSLASSDVFPFSVIRVADRVPVALSLLMVQSRVRVSCSVMEVSFALTRMTVGGERTVMEAVAVRDSGSVMLTCTVYWLWG